MRREQAGRRGRTVSGGRGIARPRGYLRVVREIELHDLNVTLGRSNMKERIACRVLSSPSAPPTSPQ